MSARRRLLSLLALAALVAPASAHAQGAGDDQYVDPFGASGATQRTAAKQRVRKAQSSQPGLSRQPPATATSPSAPAQTAPPAAPPVAPAPAAGAPLPYTGAEVPGLVLLGLGLLATGVGLRLRTVDESVF